MRLLRFAETPDYKYLRGLFQTAYRNLNYPEDGLFDWDSPVPLLFSHYLSYNECLLLNVSLP